MAGRQHQRNTHHQQGEMLPACYTKLYFGWEDLE
jgi:hypothetical protein